MLPCKMKFCIIKNNIRLLWQYAFRETSWCNASYSNHLRMWEKSTIREWSALNCSLGWLNITRIGTTARSWFCNIYVHSLPKITTGLWQQAHFISIHFMAVTTFNLCSVSVIHTQFILVYGSDSAKQDLFFHLITSTMRFRLLLHWNILKTFQLSY